MKGKHHSQATREKMSKIQKGRRVSVSSRKKMSLSVKSRPVVSKETRRKMSVAHKGERSHHWRGGITSFNQSLRTSLPYSEWRQSVFVRDEYACQHCGKIGGYLEVDHIRLFSVILKENEINTFEKAIECEELWEISNGQTLCRPCHVKKTRKDLKKLKSIH